MITTERELIGMMRVKKAMILDIFDCRTSRSTRELVDFERNDTYDNVSFLLIGRLIKQGKLKSKDTSMCLDLVETTIYLPEHEDELFPVRIFPNNPYTRNELRKQDKRNAILTAQLEIALAQRIYKDDIGEMAFHFCTGND